MSTDVFDSSDSIRHAQPLEGRPRLWDKRRDVQGKPAAFSRSIQQGLAFQGERDDFLDIFIGFSRQSQHKIELKLLERLRRHFGHCLHYVIFRKTLADGPAQAFRAGFGGQRQAVRPSRYHQTEYPRR